MRPREDKAFLPEFARSPAVIRIPKVALVPQVTLPSFATGFGALTRIPPSSPRSASVELVSAERTTDSYHAHRCSALTSMRQTAPPTLYPCPAAPETQVS